MIIYLTFILHVSEKVNIKFNGFIYNKCCHGYIDILYCTLYIDRMSMNCFYAIYLFFNSIK